MSGLSTLVGAFFRNSYRQKAVFLVMLGLALLLLAVMVSLVCLLAIAPELASPTPDASAVGRYLSLLAFGTAFIVMGMNLNVFTANSLVKEKAQGLYESILATPVGVGRFWTAKSLAVSLPGLVLCEACAAAVYLGVDLFLVLPRLGFLASPWMLVSGFVLVPVLYWPLCRLVILVGLVGNPVSGNVIANVAFAALITILINLVARGGVDPGSPVFALACAVVALAEWIVVLLLGRGLTKERVILSCKA
jgi:ABC-2 type transport system permease protein